MPRAISIPGLLPSGMRVDRTSNTPFLFLATAPEVSLDLVLTQSHILELLESFTQNLAPTPLSVY